MKVIRKTRAFTHIYITLVIVWLFIFGSSVILLPVMLHQLGGLQIKDNSSFMHVANQVSSEIPASEDLLTDKQTSQRDSQAVLPFPSVEAMVTQERDEPSQIDVEKPIVVPDLPVGNSVGNLAPDFELSTMDGESLCLYDFSGKKVMVEFWSTDCGVCIVSSPLIRETYTGHGYNNDDVIVVTVCLNAQKDRINRVIEKYNDKYGPFDFPILVDDENRMRSEYGIWGVPTTFFIDPDGVIKQIKIGRFGSREEIENILETL